jgi:Holliday junction DNA helicase RuvA
MIVAIEGKLAKKEPTLLHINVNGIYYEVKVSLNCSSNITDENIKLHTTHIIREDSQSLYGFLDLDEKKLFDTVIKINGVGPKVALAICSTFTPATFAQLISNNDVNMLKQVPGIGPKSASRILVELTGFIIDSLGNDDGNGDDNMLNSTNQVKNEAYMALESLGFKGAVIKKALTTCTSTNISDLIKEALKKLQNK